ncbi:hypothetical protein E2986_14041 [Frieseomelitta varia]|uniref:Uncharacterized protein n=1 Tax=Frieseomelitta varia TaxID=561572 RepID=A0A833VJE8_9HYME|nr:hypothetical protein E2986_14041 [Frieseomelitta varia]
MTVKNCKMKIDLRFLTESHIDLKSDRLENNKDKRGLETTPDVHVIGVASLRRVQRKRVTWTCPRSHVACLEGSRLPNNEGEQLFIHICARYLNYFEMEQKVYDVILHIEDVISFGTQVIVLRKKEKEEEYVCMYKKKRKKEK